VSLQITPNLFSQTRAGAMQRHADDQRRRAHHRPNLAVVEPFEITQRKHLGCGRSKLRYGLANQRTQLAIFRTTRQLASVFRPPYEQATVRDDRIAESLNLLDVRWNVDSLDSRHGATSASAVAAVAASVGPGSIVLLHDAHSWTGDAVRGILRVLRARHLRAVSLPDLIERDPPTGRCG